MKFYLDENLPVAIAKTLRTRGFDAVGAAEVGALRLPDAEQLARAAAAGRCLVTRNARHFLDLAHHAVSHQKPHAGIILCPPSIRGFEVGKIAERLIRVARAYPHGLGPYDVIYLP